MSEEATFAVSIIAIVLALASLGWQIKSKKYDVKKDYKEDYKEEIEPLLNHFKFFIIKHSWASWELVRLFQNNRRVSKRILQHLYTCSETRPLYDLLKEMSEDIEKRKKEGMNEDRIYETLSKQVMQFRKEFYPIWHELLTSPEPKFGICENCKDMKFDYAKKQKKIIEKLDTSLWNLFN